MSVINVKNLSKTYKVSLKKPGFKGTIDHFFKRTYRDIVAVKDVSFTINSGEIVGFLGANGAGKTTTLKMLTGLIHPSNGKIKIVDRTPFKRHHTFLKKMSLVMGQKQKLLWDLQALDSLKINAAIYEIPDKIIDVATKGIVNVFDACIKIEVENKRGVLASISSEIAQSESNIVSVTYDDTKQTGHNNMTFVVTVDGLKSLNKLITKLRKTNHVLTVRRKKS